MNLDLETRPLQTIYIAHLGESIDVDLAEKRLINDKGAVRYRDAYALRYQTGEAWLFNYGVLVCWNLTTDERQQLYLDLSDLTPESNEKLLREEYRYRLDSTESFRVQHDVIHLDDPEPLIRLALSHAFAQSTKLQIFEARAQRVIQENRSISKNLAEKAKNSLSQKAGYAAWPTIRDQLRYHPPF